MSSLLSREEKWALASYLDLHSLIEGPAGICRIADSIFDPEYWKEVYELGGYLDNVLVELFESGFCIASYLQLNINDVIENVIELIDMNNNV